MGPRGPKATLWAGAFTAALLVGGAYVLRQRIAEAWWISRLDVEDPAELEDAASQLAALRSWRAIPRLAGRLEVIHAGPGGVSQGSAEHRISNALSRALLDLGARGLAGWLRTEAWSQLRGRGEEIGRARLLDLLVSCARDPDKIVRSRALSLLEGAILGHESVFLLFLESVRDADPEIRMMAISALRAVHFSPETAWLPLLEMLRAPDRQTRVSAVQELCLFDGHGSEKLGLLRKLPAPDVAGVAEQPIRIGFDESALGALARLAGSVELFNWLRTDPGPDVQAVAFDGLEQPLEANQSMDLDAAPWVDTLLVHIGRRIEGFERRLRLLGLLGRRDPRVLPLLLALLKDPSREIRAGAARGLGALGPGAGEAVPALVACLEERPVNPELYEDAARALGGIGPSARAASPRLFLQARDGNLGEESEVREFVLIALAEIATGAPEVEKPLVDLLVELLSDPKEAELLSWGIHSALRVMGHRAQPAAGPLWKRFAEIQADRWRTIYTLLAVGPDPGLAIQELINLCNADLRDSASAQGARHGLPRALREYRANALAGLPFLSDLLSGPRSSWDVFQTVALLQPDNPGLSGALRWLSVEDSPSDIPHRDILKELACAIVPAIAGVLDDPDLRVRFRALQFLRWMGPKAIAAVPALERLEHDLTEAVRFQAAAVRREITASAR